MCSTSRFARSISGEEADDPSGDLILQKTSEANHQIVYRVLISDDREAIRSEVDKAVRNRDVDAVIVCGGTGISPRDVTVETVTPLFTKTLPGFGEIFRKLSYDSIGSAAILSRATAGLVNGKAVFCIPGSIEAVRLCLDRLILPETGHIVKHTREPS